MKTSTPKSQKIQGEGDYESDRRYRKSAESFAKSGKVDQAARNAKPDTPQEEKDMTQAEQVGLSHSKGEDPALQHAPARKP